MKEMRDKWAHIGNIAGYALIQDQSYQWAESIVLDTNGAVDEKEFITDILELLNRKYT